MAALKLHRVFLALPVPDADALQLFTRVRNRLGDNQRPVAWNNYHITIAFIGALSPDQLASLQRRLVQLTNLLPQHIEIGSLSPFPRNSSPLLAAIVKPTASLLTLRDAVFNAIQLAGLCPEIHSDFRPHITLARGKNQTFEKRAPFDQPVTCFRADTLGIYEGSTTSEGYRYQCLFSIERSADSSSA